MSIKKSTSDKETSDGIRLEECYSLLSDHSKKNLEKPGKFPFMRGIHADMYRGKTWTMRQYSGFGSVNETNERFQYLIKTGATGLSVAFDLPTQMGIDSDCSQALGEVGKTGVAIDTVDDMDQLFKDIPLESVSTSMTINATAHILLAFYLVVAERRGISWSKLQGTLQNDLLKEFIARGTYIYGPKASLKISCDIIEFCSKEVKKFNPISISGYHIREAGSTAAQEIAFTLLNGLTYVEAVLGRGLKIDEFAPRLAFFFNCHNNFFEEVAKFRAARALWARLIKERYQPRNEKSMQLRFHTQTAGSSLTAQQPINNVVRTSYQALAAVLGGTQSLHTNSYDEALGLPTQESALLALRTQQILAEETGVPDVVDPLGGSFYIEDLTSKLEEVAREIITRIEKKGGMLSAISDNMPQSMIEESAYRHQTMIESGLKKIVGVNSYLESLENKKLPAFKLDTRVEQSQMAKLTDLKGKRDGGRVELALKALKKSAKNNENIMLSVLDCARNHVTLGEISNVLLEVYGRYGQGL